jgi:hypothetical protein
MTEIPSTNVIRHWCAWGTTADCPDEHSDHSIERVEQFEAWFASELRNERERIIQLVFSVEPHLLTNGATSRDIEAFAYAIRQFRYDLVDAIKGENR